MCEETLVVDGLFIILILAIVSQIGISKLIEFVKSNPLDMFSLLCVNGTSIKLFLKTGAIGFENMRIIVKNYKICKRLTLYLISHDSKSKSKSF